MKKYRNSAQTLTRFFILFVLAFTTTVVPGQDQNGWWAPIPETDRGLSSRSQIQAGHASYYRLDLPSMAGFLLSASGNEGVTLPLPGGQLERFQLAPSTLIPAALQAKYPSVRSFNGRGIDHPELRLKLDIGPQGLHAMISGTPSAVFIDPAVHGDPLNYIVYAREDYQVPAGFSRICEVEQLPVAPQRGSQNTSRSQGDCQFRTYRLAMATTGEFSQFHGGTKASVLNAVVTIMNRVNEVYERDLAVTMTLIPNTDTLFFLDASTDPYTNNSGFAMLSENQTTVTNLIGSANYDIGHVFSTGGGGIASLGSVCNNFSKAQGVTGLPAPIGDPFSIDYVAHEMGHQFGANHTFNSGQGGCGGGRVSSTAFEVGSGTTIMAYAGLCGSDNVQFNSDDFFHAGSLEEMFTFITGGAGATCPVTAPLGNNAPEANAGLDYIIPRSTPFRLTGEAVDADNDPLTYSWEQMDNEIVNQPPTGNDTGGPLFRAYDPTPDPVRYFPSLNNLINVPTYRWEKLPAVARNINFRLTVRDNANGGGCTDEDDMVVTVDGNSGPFEVTYPNGPLDIWVVGQLTLVTWDVANTDQAPVNCQNVDILLSTDGGFTYNQVLAQNVPNDGSQEVYIPNLPGSTNRVMVAGRENIFFSISDQNFPINLPASPTYILEPTPENQLVCAPDDIVIDVDVVALSGFNQAVTLNALGAPSGATVNFTANPVSPGQSTQLVISNTGQSAAGQFTITINGTVSGGPTVNRNIQVSLVSNDPDTVNLLQPLNGGKEVDFFPVLTWNSLLNSGEYEVEVSTSPAFSPVFAQGEEVLGTSWKLSEKLDHNTVYYWRVRASTQCGQGPWSKTFAFQTRPLECQSYTPSGLPLSISGSGTPTVNGFVSVGAAFNVEDVNVLNIQGTHTNFAELSFTLRSPAGQEVAMVQNQCPGSNLFAFNIDDSGLPQANCPYFTTDPVRPEQPLSAFDGSTSNGLWALIIRDQVPGGSGQVSTFELELCSSTSQKPAVPALVANDTLFVAQADSGQITQSLLNATEAGSTPAELTYTMEALPQFGVLKRLGSPLGLGDTFTQDDINNNRLRYVHDGPQGPIDEIGLSVLTQDGGWLPGITQVVKITNFVGIEDDLLAGRLRIFPNPSSGNVTIELIEDGTSPFIEARVFDLSGKRIASQASSESTLQLDLQTLPEGIYLIEVTNGRGRAMEKLILR